MIEFVGHNLNQTDLNFKIFKYRTHSLRFSNLKVVKYYQDYQTPEWLTFKIFLTRFWNYWLTQGGGGGH